MTTPPSAPPDSVIEAAVAAATGAIPVSPIEVGAVVNGGDDHAVPDDAPVYLALRVSGSVEGTVTIAVGDEFTERLTYAAGTDEAADALAPVAQAIVGALGELGPVEATPLAGVAATDWPGEGPVVSSVGVRDSVDDLVLSLALALTAVAVVADTGAVAGQGTSSLSTSVTGADDSVVRLGRSPAPAAALSGEAARLATVEVDLAGVLGEAIVELHELMDWLPGVIVPLQRTVGEPVDIRINDVVVAHAEVVVVDEHYGLRVLDVVASARAGIVHRHRSPRSEKTES